MLLVCRCNTFSFGFCHKLELDGNFIATDGALTENFALAQMEQKFQTMPTGLKEESKPVVQQVLAISNFSCVGNIKHAVSSETEL